MSAGTIRIESVERLAQGAVIDRLSLKPGVNVLVGEKDTGKTGWLRTISFLLGDTDTPDSALGAGVAAKFDAARLQLVIGGDEKVRLERRWKEPGAKHKIFINGEAIASAAFSQWIHDKLSIPKVHFPKGNPYSGATWPELSWRMLFRHVYREERFWSDLADKQPEREQHACLLQFLGVASQLYSEELGEEINLRQNLLHLRARKEQFKEVLQQAARGLIADPSITEAPTHDAISSAFARLRTEISDLQSKREQILSDALARNGQRPELGLALERELVERRTANIAQRQELLERALGLDRRLKELTIYRASVTAELTRIHRVEAAEELFRPLSVIRCPHCDQKVSSEKVAPGDCFVCHQRLPYEATSEGRGPRARLEFEDEQLRGEDSELQELIESLKSEQHALKQQLRNLDVFINEVDSALRPTRAAFAAVAPAGLEATNVRLGQLEERVAQLQRLNDTLDQLDVLVHEIDALEKKAQTTSAVTEQLSAGIPFEQLSEGMTARINEYLTLLKEADSRRWEHQLVRFRINERSFRLLVGSTPWSAIGATSVGLLLLGYHYALLQLSGKPDFKYPGLALVDFPMTLADGSSIADKENYLIEPFVKLAMTNAAAQVIICGRAFKGLKGANRIHLTEVWTQGDAPKSPLDVPPPNETEYLDLTIAAHFHSGHGQIMMVLDPGEVARLGKVLPELRTAIASRQTWPGKEVKVMWIGGYYVTKLVHHIDNGNVKFTVRKKSAQPLWRHLDELLREANPARSFRARYTVGVGGALDEFYVDVPMTWPPE